MTANRITALWKTEDPAMLVKVETVGLTPYAILDGLSFGIVSAVIAVLAGLRRKLFNKKTKNFFKHEPLCE
jgi:hypothetical protein